MQADGVDDVVGSGVARVVAAARAAGGTGGTGSLACD
jgi:hypothetical protein